MSITQKHLHELLQEDQESFKLNNYIADRRQQLKTKTAATNKFNNSSALHPKKLNKPLATLRKQACFLSFYDSPDFRKSPLYTPTNISPNKNPSAAVFLHIPAKTAAMLLEAAMRIQKQSAKPKKGNAKSVRFGLFGSIFKRLKDKSKSNKKPEIDMVNKSGNSLNENENRKSTGSKRQNSEGIVEDVVIMSVDEKISGKYQPGFSFSCNNSRLSSAGWSESNEDNKSLDMDMETSCSTSRSDYMEQDIIHEFSSYENHFCLSPSSPFRFALQQQSPSRALQTPDLSPPTRHVMEETENQLGDNLQKNQLEEEEDKDQCSPVSVLDPPFKDDDDEQNGGDEEEEGDEDDDYDMECSYAFVQRAKLQLLHKLRRFERLAELDPIELEKRMSEEDEDDDEELIKGEEWINIDEPRSFCSKEKDEFTSLVFSKSNLCSLNKIPADFRRLVLDLIAEERKKETDYTNEVIMSNVCKRLDSWKEVESNTIDMMVELDLRRELNGWKGYPEEAREKATEIEIAIFGLLLEELVA